MTDSTILIRTAGTYEITYDGQRLYCNGVETSMVDLRKPIIAGGRVLIALVDAKRRGANGKWDQVGLTAAEVAAIRAASAEYNKPLTEAYERTAQRIANREQERKIAERSFDALYNEGGEGFNPHRRGAARTYR